MPARVVVLSLIAHAALFWAICVAYSWEVVPYVGWGPFPGRFEADAGADAQRPTLGEAEGTGLSLATSELVTLLQSQVGSQQQPFLSEDDVGPLLAFNLFPADGALPPGERPVEPAPASLRDLENPAPARPIETGVLADRSAVPPMRMPRVIAPSGDAALVERGTEERPPAEPDEAPAEQLARVDPGTRSTSPAGRSGGSGGANAGRPGSPDRPADALPRSDRPMDGFTRVESIEMTPGGSIARKGKRVRIPRPQFNLATAADVWAGLRLPQELRFEVTLDDTGRVRFARLVRGTGMMSIDRPMLNAVHGGEFAPSLDADGKPVSDIIGLTITLR